MKSMMDIKFTKQEDFGADVFEAGMAGAAVPGVAPFALAASAGAGIGVGLVEMLDSIF